MKTTGNFWQDTDVISVYTRAQAIADGALVDASRGDLADVTRQHYKVPVAMTAAVFAIIERAVKNPRWLNDYRGVWHDVLYMSKRNAISRPDPTTAVFQVVITGAGRSKYYTLKAVAGPGDAGELVVTIMLPNED